MELPFNGPTSWVYLGLLVVFALIFVAFLVTIFRDSARRRRSASAAETAASATPAEPAKPGTLAAALADPEAQSESFLCRFVTNGKGETAGETLGIHGDRVILKKNDKFLSVSVNAVEVRGDDLVAPNVDWALAERDGEAWRAGHKDAIVYDESGMPTSAAANRA